jgi:hypothetical protein
VFRNDEDADSRMESTVELSDNAEAEALREELLAYLKSPAAQKELETIVAEPLRKAVSTALLDQTLQQQLRDHIVKSLGPSLSSAAQEAVTAALRDQSLVVDDKNVAALRTRAEKAIREAFAKAQEEALFALPKLVEQTKKEVRQHVEKAAREAAAQGRRGYGSGGAASEEDRKGIEGTEHSIPRRPPAFRQERVPLWSMFSIGVTAVLFVAVLFVVGLAWIFSRKGDADQQRPPATDSDTAYTSTTAVAGAESPKPSERDPPRMYLQYTRALERLPAKFTGANQEQLQCIEQAMRVAQPDEGTRGYLDTVRTSLNGCEALTIRPSGALKLVAHVQQGFNDARPWCSQLPNLDEDGLHGQSTGDALKAYTDCLNPSGIPPQFATLADYATVGIYFVHKRSNGQ